jgi:hypothetical protein
MITDKFKLKTLGIAFVALIVVFIGVVVVQQRKPPITTKLERENMTQTTSPRRVPMAWF